MKIDGRLIASLIKSGLRDKISILKQKSIMPQLAVILFGNDPGSVAYVGQKQKVGVEIGAKVSLFKEQTTYNKDQLIDLARKLNNDKTVHGIIIQRPVPIDISNEELNNLVLPSKDVDGFHPDSPFTPPIALAVVQILNYIHKHLIFQTPQIQAAASNRGVLQNKVLFNWLNKKRVLIIGRGETAGKPIAETLKKMRLKIEVAHSRTTNLKELCLGSDIIISCVGKRPILRLSEGGPQNVSPIVRHDMITNKTILIGVGLHQENGKLFTDYNQEEVAYKVAFYTPVPGGVGPVNVACLFENLLLACRIS